MFPKIKLIIKKLLSKYYLNKYNDFTIAEYLRAQGAHIGRHNRIEIRSLGPEPYLVSIGNHCTIASNVRFLTHDGAVWVFTDSIPDLQKFGPITIHDNCFIGIDSIIMGNVEIGPNAIVGAGSVVTKSVPPDMVVAGNPAKPVSTLSQYKKKALKIWEKQKPPGYFHGVTGRDLSPEDIQALKHRDMPLLKEHLMNIFKLCDE